MLVRGQRPCRLDLSRTSPSPPTAALTSFEQSVTAADARSGCPRDWPAIDVTRTAPAPIGWCRRRPFGLHGRNALCISARPSTSRRDYYAPNMRFPCLLFQSAHYTGRRERPVASGHAEGRASARRHNERMRQNLLAGAPPAAHHFCCQKCLLPAAEERTAGGGHDHGCRTRSAGRRYGRRAASVRLTFFFWPAAGAPRPPAINSRRSPTQR